MKRLLLFGVFLIGLETQAQNVEARNISDIVIREKKLGRDLLYLPDNGNLYKASKIIITGGSEGKTVAVLNNAFLIGNIPLPAERGVCDFLALFIQVNCFSGSLNNVSPNGSGQVIVECLPSLGICFLAL